MTAPGLTNFLSLNSTNLGRVLSSPTEGLSTGNRPPGGSGGGGRIGEGIRGRDGPAIGAAALNCHDVSVLIGLAVSSSKRSSSSYSSAPGMSCGYLKKYEERKE